MIEGKLSRDLEFPRSTLVNNSTTKESFALIILNYIYRVLELKDVSKVKCLRAHAPSISAPDEDQNGSYGFSNGSGCSCYEQQPPKPYGTSTGFTPNIAVSAELSQR